MARLLPPAPPSKPNFPPNIVVVWDRDIQELLSKIDMKLPNVAEASHDLQALRDLFGRQLLDATALQSKFPLTYLKWEMSSRPPS